MLGDGADRVPRHLNSQYCLRRTRSSTADTAEFSLKNVKMHDSQALNDVNDNARTLCTRCEAYVLLAAHVWPEHA